MAVTHTPAVTAADLVKALRAALGDGAITGGATRLDVVITGKSLWDSTLEFYAMGTEVHGKPGGPVTGTVPEILTVATKALQAMGGTVTVHDAEDIFDHSGQMAVTAIPGPNGWDLAPAAIDGSHALPTREDMGRHN
jgi:hypothetical protein